MLSRKNTLFVVGCLFLGLVVAVLTSLARSYWLSRFDYDVIRKNEKIEWGGPKEGERIDLSMLRTEHAESFPVFSDKSLILLSVVDAKCEMCRLSADLIEQVKTEAELHQVRFFAVSFDSDSQKEEFFRFAQTISKSEENYLWQGEKASISPALQKMVVPSLLLINEKGIVLRRFPGSSREKAIRYQMAKQIIDETLAEKARLRRSE